MENFTGLIILAVGIYFKLYGDSDLDALKAYSAMAGGLGYLGWTNYSFIKSWFTKKPTSNPEQIFSPKEYELHDTNCLIHLRNRCIENNSIEGVETCAKLNAIMFGFKKVENKNPIVVPTEEK